MRWLFAFLCLLLSALCFAYVGYVGYASIGLHPNHVAYEKMPEAASVAIFITTVYGMMLLALAHAAAKFHYSS